MILNRAPVTPLLAPIGPLSRPYRAPIAPLSRPYRAPIGFPPPGINLLSRLVSIVPKFRPDPANHGAVVGFRSAK